LLRLDLTKVRLDVVHALDAAIGIETTSSIATRHGGIAAINVGFFKMTGLHQGDATSVLKIDGKLLSESYSERVALGILNKSNLTEIVIGRLNMNVEARFKNQTRKVSGINRERRDDELILFTPEFHRTTLTDSNGLEILVRKEKIVEIRDAKGSSLIPSDGFVLSASGKQRLQLLDTVKVGMKVNFNGKLETGNSADLKYEKQQNLFSESEDIVDGVPFLIENGKIEITWEREKIGKEFATTRHPRTAVARLKDGKILMATVDGRQPNISVGMNLQELAEMLLELGAVEAMNLDGGGSTTMFLNGKVVNQPSDKEGERKVAAAILVFPRK
ncbi:MAG: phosphodiester glycosidase family protein, partial [Pyrinomonadaceae bacterium]